MQDSKDQSLGACKQTGNSDMKIHLSNEARRSQCSVLNEQRDEPCLPVSKEDDKLDANHLEDGPVGCEIFFELPVDLM